MRRRGYRITITSKILILQFFITLIGVLCGFTWKTYSDNKKWDKLIYPGTIVSDLDLGGKTVERAKKEIKSQYIDRVLKRNIRISAKGKVFVIQNSKLISKIDMDSVINKAFSFGKHLDEYKKSKLIKEGASQQYAVAIAYNESYIKEVVSTIKKDIDREPVDANIHKSNNGAMEIVPDIKGYILQGDKLEELIKKSIGVNDIEIEAPVEETKAGITFEILSGINTKIASFNTEFLSSSPSRVKNIELSTSLINGRLLMPNDVFSFNDSVGERTKERGFMEASVIVGDKIEMGFGGGICQVSSTLYNAILRTGIKPFERSHHTLPSAYVGLGLDATVDWNNIDFKFKNTLAYPIYIEGYTENKNLYINIYSNASLAKREYIITNNVYETIQQTTKTINDSNLYKGQVLTVQRGLDGHRVKVKRDTYENGVVIGSESISDDFYIPIPSIIKVGMKTDK